MKFSTPFLKVILPILIIGVGLVSWAILKNLPPKKAPKASGNVKFKIAHESGKVGDGIPVIAYPLVQQDYQVKIISRGVVTAGEEIDLSAESSGKIMSIAPEFEPGSMIKKGHLLVKVDTLDLEADLIIAQSRIAQAEAVLAQEQARADQALLNWEEIGYEEAPTALVLRKPQLKQAQASLDSAIAQVEKIEREIARASVVAPFDCIIAERTVSVGEIVNRGKALGRLIGSDYVTTTLPVSEQDRTFLPTQLDGTIVDFVHPLSSSGHHWQGILTHIIPEVNSSTKLPHIAARINAPFSPQTTHSLQIGQPLLASIHGRILEDVYVVPKSALRSPDEIHIMDEDNTLQLHKITPILTDQDHIIFRDAPDTPAHWVESKLQSWKIGKTLSLITETGKDS